MACSTMVVGVLLLSFATTVASAQSDWKTYRNDRMGFEARHPSDWHVDSPRGSGPESVLLRAPRQGEQPSVTVQFWVQRQMNPHGVTIEQWYGDQMKKMPPESTKGITTTNTVMGGRPAVHRMRVGTLGRSVDFFVALNKTDVFQISILRPAAETQLDPTLEKLLSTLKFIE